ncbi:hypothetical protein DSO57_1026956 [Entomophthora muscae]|uniref:Uncharacterized protein n=2 Tax=Entomophthora muscae TaxID=34485 RepID=A0ACC2TD46_9FUNG|nr:hypothetical protein DSO57_1026956 [Entomophthora muscae]
MTEAALLASSLAALVSRSIMHPMDTIRLRLQLGPGANETKQLSVVQQFNARTLNFRHISSLYSGYSVAVGFTIPGLAVFLTSYDLTKSAISHYTPFKTDHTLNHCASGFVAQGLAGLVFNPMEVVKGYLQTQKAAPLRHIVGSIFRNQGITGFFRGYWLSVAVFGPHNVIYFATYEKIKALLSREREPLALQHFIFASSTATLLGATLTHPIDVVRARYQIHSTSRSMNPTSLPHLTVQQMMGQMWKQGGIKPFSGGLFCRVAYLVPSTALSMTMFESFKPLFLRLLNSPSIPI